MKGFWSCRVNLADWASWAIFSFSGFGYTSRNAEFYFPSLFCARCVWKHSADKCKQSTDLFLREFLLSRNKSVHGPSSWHLLYMQTEAWTCSSHLQPWVAQDWQALRKMEPGLWAPWIAGRSPGLRTDTGYARNLNLCVLDTIPQVAQMDILWQIQ
jgi:hypothetical protein